MCLQLFFGLLEFFQGFKAFLFQISDLFIVANGVQFIGKDLVFFRGQVAPTSYARRWLTLELSLNKHGSRHKAGWLAGLAVPKLDLSAKIKEKQ